MGERSRLAQFPGQRGYLPRRLIAAARSGENSGPPLTGLPGCPFWPLPHSAYRGTTCDQMVSEDLLARCIS